MDKKLYKISGSGFLCQWSVRLNKWVVLTKLTEKQIAEIAEMQE